MNAKQLISLYKKETKSSSIYSANVFKAWIEKHTGKKMNFPLFIAVGKGGGQTYKTLFEVYDPDHNNNRTSVFFNENYRAISDLERKGHISLDKWLKG